VKSKKHKKLVCPYLNENTHLCKIYKKRPLDCKIWPLLFMYSKNKDKILLACWDKDACPRTDKMNRKEYVKYLKEQQKEISKINIPAFLKKHPEYIWNYEKYTFKVKELSRTTKA
ncbi:YkgJ family cysteine cluster protein, partial [Candidatus Woesearchaeota archaeon]|nr:YkgJ family cysteine cluster protein [Candidatus Woesearchaeota archaeon]